MLKILISGFLWVGLLLTLPALVTAQKSDSNTEISIGLLVNEMNEKQAINSANRVIRRINDSGGVQGKKLKLKARLVKGAWGAGSSQIVDLVFRDKVAGIIGALDGRNAHLAEQVIAKTQVLYISAWASDPTLSKAYVSWYFTVVPTDDQQAKLLVETIDRDHQGGSGILIIHDGSYDAVQSLNSFRTEMTKKHKFQIQTQEILPLSQESEWGPNISTSKMDVFVVFGNDLPIFSMNEALEKNDKKKPVMYLNLAVSGSLDFENRLPFESNNIRIISNSMAKDSGNPGRVEGYVEDALTALITSLQNADSDFSDVQKVMSEINFQGVTGKIEFDELGRLKNVENQLKIATAQEILN